MKRLILAGIAVAALAGCQNNNRDEVAEKRQDLQQTQRDANEKVAEARQDANEDVARQREELAEAQRERQEERAENTGAPLSFTGTVTAAKDNELDVRASTGEEWQLKLADNALILENNQPIRSNQITEGAQIRASYRMEDGDRVADKVEITRPGAPAPSRDSTGTGSRNTAPAPAR